MSVITELGVANSDPVTMDHTNHRRTPGCLSDRPRHTWRWPVAASVMALAAAAATPAIANPDLSRHQIEFEPSPSESVVGYVLHLGFSPRDYAHSVDLGAPNAQNDRLVYEASLTTEIDLYVAISSYDTFGNESVYSNEFHLAAVATPPPAPEPPPAPTPDPDPVPEPDPTPDPGPTPAPNPTPTPAPGLWGLGLTADPTGLIRSVLSDGGTFALTLDSLAAAGDLRPDRCDLDGDGDSDIVLGFGPGSDGTIALLHLEDGALEAVDSLVVGDAAYHAADGQTHPACGDIDGDGAVELVVGLGPDADFMLHVIDDAGTDYAAFDVGNAGQFRVPTNSRIRNRPSALVPALGDIDGDDRDELVVGFAAAGIRDIAILDDGAEGFVGHPNVTTRKPLVRVAGRGDLDTRGGGTFPTLGDWDGDGLDEILVGYGEDSDGWIRFLDDATALEYDKYNGFLRTQVGRPDWREANGSARPRFGNFDGDEAEEIVVSFAGSGRHELQLFDDMYGGKMAIFRGGMGFASSDDADAIWIAAPAR